MKTMNKLGLLFILSLALAVLNPWTGGAYAEIVDSNNDTSEKTGDDTGDNTGDDIDDGRVPLNLGKTEFLYVVSRRLRSKSNPTLLKSFQENCSEDSRTLDGVETGQFKSLVQGYERYLSEEGGVKDHSGEPRGGVPNLLRTFCQDVQETISVMEEEAKKSTDTRETKGTESETDSDTSTRTQTGTTLGSGTQTESDTRSDTGTQTDPRLGRNFFPPFTRTNTNTDPNQFNPNFDPNTSSDASANSGNASGGGSGSGGQPGGGSSPGSAGDSGAGANDSQHGNPDFSKLGKSLGDALKNNNNDNSNLLNQLTNRQQKQPTKAAKGFNSPLLTQKAPKKKAETPKPKAPKKADTPDKQKSSLDQLAEFVNGNGGLNPIFAEKSTPESVPPPSGSLAFNDSGFGFPSFGGGGGGLSAPGPAGGASGGFEGADDSVFNLYEGQQGYAGSGNYQKPDYAKGEAFLAAGSVGLASSGPIAAAALAKLNAPQPTGGAKGAGGRNGRVGKTIDMPSGTPQEVMLSKSILGWIRRTVGGFCQIILKSGKPAEICTQAEDEERLKVLNRAERPT